jgi:hypothetical protein
MVMPRLTHIWDNIVAHKEKTLAIAYLRTSSAANVGTDKDSDKRQRAAIEVFAKRAGYELVDEFYDAAVSGADPIDMRPGFAAMLERIERNGVRTIIFQRNAWGPQTQIDRSVMPITAAGQQRG